MPPAAAGPSDLTASRLRVNSLVEPTQVPGQDIRFNWTASSPSRNARAGGCQVQLAAGNPAAADWAEPRWDSGLRLADRHAGDLRYDGQQLDGNADYSWRVRLADAEGVMGEWSAPQRFETAMGADFPESARWIALPDWAKPGDTAAVQYLRCGFELTSGVVRARAYVSALGWYRLSANGRGITGRAFVPGFTAFESRVEYQSYDITALLTAGPNTLGIQLADGRYRGRNGGGGARAVYGEQTAAIAYVVIELQDGTTAIVTSDTSWIGGSGAIIAADPKDGETIDLRAARPGWDTVSEAPADFRPVIDVGEHRVLVPTTAEGLVAVTEVAAVSVTRLDDDRQLVDFGINVVGVVRLAATGASGTRITVDFGEVLTPTGELDRDYLEIPGLLGPLVQRDTFILAGTGRETFEPAFTIHGFRYAEVTGYPGDLVDVTALVYSAALDYAGTFRASDPRLTLLHDNIRRSMRGNFTDVPTDCPTRERSGWTGDAQVFARAATLLAPVEAFLSRWLVDLALQQAPDGKVPDIVPRDGRPGDHLLSLIGGAAGWGDAAVLIPWTLYERFGDVRVLERQYESMTRWVEFTARRAAENRHPDRIARGAEQPHERFLVDSGFHWGEWLEPGDTFDNLGALATADASYVATPYFALSSRVLAQVAELLGQLDDAQRFRGYARGAREAWRTEFMVEPGRILPDRQASYARALRFDLLDEDERAGAQLRLTELILECGRHVGTGFLSTGFLLDVLSDAGRSDLALDLLVQTEEPSWLAQLAQGATTIWENWSGYDPDGFAHASHNHYALGAVAAWLYERLAGIRPTEPGWASFVVDPLMTDERITSASASTVTPHGEAAVSWERRGPESRLRLIVPVGCGATIILPGAQSHTLHESGAPIPAGQVVRQSSTSTTVQVGSGNYAFEWSTAGSVRADDGLRDGEHLLDAELSDR